MPRLDQVTSPQEVASPPPQPDRQPERSPRTPRGPSEAGQGPSRGGAFLLEPVLKPTFTREQFSQDQKDIEAMVQDFAANRIQPQKEELSKLDKELSVGLMREVGELGLTGIDVPEEYGGMGLDKTTSALVVEALTTGGNASWVVTFSAHVGIGTLPIVFFGDERQKAEYLPKLATAEHIGAYSLTEAEAGSDAGSMRTTARLSEDGESFLLSGTKIYVTNCNWADIYTVFAQLEGKGPTAFIVERGFPGLVTGPEEKKLGIKGSSTASLFLDNARVPKENLLGAPGAGLQIALNILNIGRFKLGAADLGGCKSATTLATQYALERKQFGQPIAYFSAIRKKLADMVVRTYMLDSVIYSTVGLMDQRIALLDPKHPNYGRHASGALEEYAIEASISKILGSETMFRVADQGLQIYGGNGFSEEYPLAQMVRDTRIDRIFEGTNEINRMVIYGYFLKKALMEELPLRDAEKAWEIPAVAEGGPFAWEVRALDAGRRVSLKCLFEAISRYGQDLRNEQIVGEDLADLAIGYFAASTAINRLLQLGEGQVRQRPFQALARLVVATYLEEVNRLYFRLRPSLFSERSRFAEPLDRIVQGLQLPFDPVREVQVLTDDLFHHEKYRF